MTDKMHFFDCIYDYEGEDLKDVKGLKDRDRLFRNRQSVIRNRLIAAVLLALMLSACSDKPSLGAGDATAERKTATLRKQLEEVQGIAEAPEAPVIKLAPAPISEELSITGELTPINSVIVKPLMDGRITFVRPIKVGDTVKKGELIAKIDDRDIEDEIALQEKQITLGDEKLRLAQESLGQNQKNLEFDRQLVKEGYLNQNEFERTQMSLKSSEIELSQNRITQDQDRTRLSKALRQREKVPIVAPIGGMVVLASHLTSTEGSANTLLNEEIMSQEGTLVGTATPLFGIVSQDGYLAECQANGRDKAKIREGQAARVTVITHQPITVPGKIGKISLLQDAKTHAYKVWIGLDQFDPSFTSGLFVRAAVELDRRAAALVVRKEFVKERNNRQFVQVVQGSTVKDRWITEGVTQDDRVELASGVRAGEMLLASKEVFAAEQVVRPVVVKEEAAGGADLPDLKVLPGKDVLPLVFNKKATKGRLITLKLDNPTSFTQAALHVRRDKNSSMQINITVTKNNTSLNNTDKVLYEGKDVIQIINVPLNCLVKGENNFSVQFDGDYSYMNGDMNVKEFELWMSQ